MSTGENRLSTGPRAAERSGKTSPASEAWTVERLAPGGIGFLKLPDGRAAFVPGGMPGDTLRPLQITDHRSYVRAERWELLTPSPDRVAPGCPHAADCGGCDLMELAGPAQRQAKADMLRQALTRTGGFRTLPELDVLSAGASLGYRLRLRLHVDESGTIGLLARGSHRVVPIGGCAVSDPAINRALEGLRRAAPPEPLRELGEIELRASPRGEGVLAILHRRHPGELAPALRAAVDALRREMDVHVEGEPFEIERAQRFELASGVELLAPPEAFTQVNWAVNERLVEAVVAGAEARQVESFLELFCGVGNFSLPLLAAGKRGRSVERSAVAIDAARRAARQRGLPEDGFVAGDAERELRRQMSRSSRVDLLLLDPPRRGAPELMRRVAALKPSFVAYVACDPVTLARDLRKLASSGYRLEALEAFDMFPHTHHVETLAWMRRG